MSDTIKTPAQKCVYIPLEALNHLRLAMHEAAGMAESTDDDYEGECACRRCIGRKLRAALSVAIEPHPNIFAAAFESGTQRIAALGELAERQRVLIDRHERALKAYQRGEVMGAPPSPQVRALLARAADAAEKGSEHEGQCAGCGMSSFHMEPEVPPGEHHGPDCIVREIRALLGEPAVAAAIPDGPPVPSQIPPLACGAKHEGFMCTRPAGHQGDHEAEDVLRLIVARWHEPEAPPETFAVIRYTGGGPDSAICGPVEEAQWDFFSRHAKGWEVLCRGLPSFEIAETIAQTLSSRPFSE